MEKTILIVYEDDFKTIKKEVIAEPGKIPFGIVRKIMKVLKSENVNNTAELMRIVTDMWDDVIKVLTNVFPDMKEEDWDNVDTQELVAVLWQMTKHYFKSMLNLPTEKNG